MLNTNVREPVTMKVNTKAEDIERILESAVVVNWADLIGGRQSGLIRIEYSFDRSDTLLDCVRVWSSIRRGYWLLACTYWMSASGSHSAGVRFDNGFKSEGLAHILELVMQHQNLFALPRNLGREGVLQIAMPTEKERTAATVSINEALNRVNSVTTLVTTETKPPLPLGA